MSEQDTTPLDTDFVPHKSAYQNRTHRVFDESDYYPKKQCHGSTPCVTNKDWRDKSGAIVVRQATAEEMEKYRIRR